MDKKIYTEGYSIPHEEITVDKLKEIEGIRVEILNKFVMVFCETPEAELKFSEFSNWQQYKFYNVSEAKIPGRYARIFARYDGMPLKPYHINMAKARFNIFAKTLTDRPVYVLERTKNAQGDNVVVREMVTGNLIAKFPANMMDYFLNDHYEMERPVKALMEWFSNRDTYTPGYIAE